MPEGEPSYPAEYESDVRLRDGSTVHLRPIRPDDDEAMLALFSRFSERTIYMRFHHATRMTPETVRFYTHVDYANSFALVSTTGSGPERILAVGRYARLADPTRAEVAFVVEDVYQGKGLATQLPHHLAAIAREKGIRVFEGDVLGENREMMEVFRDSGYRVKTSLRYGEYHVEFPIDREASGQSR